METIFSVIFTILMIATTVVLYIYIYIKHSGTEESSADSETAPLQDDSALPEEGPEESTESNESETEDNVVLPEAEDGGTDPEATESPVDDSIPAEEETGRRKHNKKLVAAAIGVLAIQLFIFYFCAYTGRETFLKAFINAEAFAWIAAIGYIDLKKKIIPNVLILAGIAFAVIIILIDIFAGGTSVRESLGGALFGGGIIGGVLFVVSLITRSALGMGDVKLFFVLGLLFGLWDTSSILILTAIVMAIVSVVLLATKKADKKTKIPMAPFAVAALLIEVITGV
ncbi:MAG: prepilin peptidase [Clostridia bacterium]|nr:prepilin peptidase [Clostridia bacterium]